MEETFCPMDRNTSWLPLILKSPKLLPGKGGKVVIEYSAEDRITMIVKFTLASQLQRLLGMTHIYNTMKSVLISALLANPLMMAINDICIIIQQIILPERTLILLSLWFGRRIPRFQLQYPVCSIDGCVIENAMEPSNHSIFNT